MGMVMIRRNLDGTPMGEGLPEVVMGSYAESRRPPNQHVPNHCHDLDDMHGLADAIAAIQQAAAANAASVVMNVVLTAQMIADKGLTLPVTPRPDSVEISLTFGSQQMNGVDFYVTGNAVRWDALGLDSILAIGDLIIVKYGV